MYHPLDAVLALFGAITFIHGFFNLAWLGISTIDREDPPKLLPSFVINLSCFVLLLALGFINSALPEVRFY